MMVNLKVFLHSWEDVNPEQHRRHISAERESGGWGNTPKTLTVPDGWALAEAKDGSIQLYDEQSRHVELCRVRTDLAAVEAAGSFGVRWLALSDAEEGSVCCPTCGHAI